MSNYILINENNFMKKILIIALAVCGAYVSSCTETTEGFLDSKGKEVDDREAVFSDSIKTMGFHAALFWQIGRIAMAPNGNSLSLQEFTNYEACTDNSRHTWHTLNEFCPAYTEGDFSQNGTNAGFYFFKKGWEEMYQTIYRCNSFLENYQKAPLTQPTKDKLAIEARFIRAFFYFHLIRQYGGVPLLYDKVIDPFNPEKLSRSTFEECINYITGELEEIAEILPEVQDGADYGRPTKGSALGLLTEVYALAASPLHNGGNIGSGDNRLLVGYDDYDVKRWEKVKDAAERLMALGTHDLIIDNETRPGNGFYIATTTRVNKERVWFWITVPQSYPHNVLLPQSRGGKHRVFPYHELVEAFPMKNGKPIKDEYSGYNEERPYDNRDPRLDYTIIYNESEWITSEGSDKKEPVYTYRGASQDGYGVGSGTPTGYFFRKCCEEHKLGNKTSSEGQGLSFIRYADIMLLYAEALTELNLDANRSEIEKQLFAIRNRAGIEPGDDNRYGIPANMNKDEMIEFIINERRIEFANECGNRFWDLKRRKMYERLDGVWTSAAVWEKSGDFFTWSVMPIQEHHFQQRMYFSAIPQKEIDASHGELIQNPGW